MSDLRYPVTDPRSLKKLIADRLRFWISRRGYRADETVAHESGIHKGNISKHINEQSLPSLPSLMKIADALDISVDELLTDSPVYLAEKKLAYVEQQRGEWSPPRKQRKEK